VRAYKRDVVPGRIGGFDLAVEERGPYRLRTASDVPYVSAYSWRHDGFGHRLGAVVAGLTVSHLLIPIGLFCVFMTNRRYGPSYAFAQVMVTVIAVVAVVLFAGGALAEFVRQETVPSFGEAAAFGGAFFAASFVSIVVFDGARGPMWWTAPLLGFLSAAIVYAGVFTALQPSGGIEHALQYMGVLTGEGILLLVPFWAMRRMVPPMAGFGGY
jgi:hypothetical protein